MNAVSPSYPARLLLTVVLYLALYVTVAHIAWWLRTPEPGRLRSLGHAACRWARRSQSDTVVRLAYCLVPCYLALHVGWASPMDVGLADLNWILGVGLSVLLGTLSLALLCLTWWLYVRLLGRVPQLPEMQRLGQPWGWALVVREAILMETAWAFCRSPMLLLAGPYYGVYWGLAAIFAVALLDPRIRDDLGRVGLREQLLLAGSLAIVTSTLYGFIHNLWLCVAVHALLRLAVLQFLRQQARSKTGRARSPQFDQLTLW